MSEKKEVQQLEIPSVELLEGELKRTRYNRRYRRTLRTTIFSLLLVAAAAVIIAVLLLPVLQISGDSMEGTLSDGDTVLSLNDGKYKTGDIIGFYYNYEEYEDILDLDVPLAAPNIPGVGTVSVPNAPQVIEPNQHGRIPNWALIAGIVLLVGLIAMLYWYLLFYRKKKKYASIGEDFEILGYEDDDF